MAKFWYGAGFKVISLIIWPQSIVETYSFSSIGVCHAYPYFCQTTVLESWKIGKRTPKGSKSPKWYEMSEGGCASYLETDDSSRSWDPVWKRNEGCWLQEWDWIIWTSVELRRALSGKRGRLTSFWSVQLCIIVLRQNNRKDTFRAFLNSFTLTLVTLNTVCLYLLGANHGNFIWVLTTAKIVL